jgi:hypothetical protein
MSLITKITSLFRGSDNEQGDLQFRDASEAYRVAFERIEPLTRRSFSVDQSSPIWLDASDLDSHRLAIRELTTKMDALSDALNAIDPASRAYENKFRLYSAACEMHRKSLTAYEMAATYTGLAAAKHQFTLWQKKSSALAQSPDAGEEVQREIDALNLLSDTAELSREEAASLTLQLDSSIEMAKLVYKAGR